MSFSYWIYCAKGDWFSLHMKIISNAHTMIKSLEKLRISWGILYYLLTILLIV